MTTRNLDIAAVASTPEHTRATWKLAELLAAGYVRLLTSRGQDRSEIAPACRCQIVLDSPAQQRDELSMRTGRRT